MAGIFKNKLPLVIAAMILLFMIVLSAVSEGYYGGADNITHYLISRYAFEYPSLFLNAWGRPLYTLVSAPFAQFGLQGAKMLNILLGVLTAWFAFRIVQDSEIKPAWPVLVFVCFTPLYFMMMPTALTEILFSFLVVLFVFLFLRKNYIAAAVVISFLPFARTEGFVLFPLFFLAFVWVRQYKALVFLAAGVIVFSVAGSFYYDDLFWVFTRFPYPVTYHHPVYNKPGSLFHFLASRDRTLGLPLELLFIAGVAATVRDAFSGDPGVRKRMQLLLFLVAGPFVLYVVLHSVLYWKALGGSMGLERVLAAVMPLAAIMALKGFAALLALSGTNRWLKGIFTALIVVVVITIPFRNETVPLPLSPEEKTIREACGWLQSSPYTKQVVFYTDNNVPFYLQKDPWKKDPAQCVLFGDTKYLDTIPAGTVVVWDAHFGANESKIPLDSLLSDKRQKLLQYFRPESPWITFGGGEYECCITLTLAENNPYDNYALLDSIKEALEAKNCADTLFYRSYENPGDAWNPSYFSTENAFKGKQSLIIDGRTEFSQGLTIPVSELKVSRPDSTVKPAIAPGIKAVAYIHLNEAPNSENTLLVISFEHEGKPYSYASINLNSLKIRPGHWRRVNLETPIPYFKSPDDLLKVYIWNPGKQVFLVDEFRVETVRQVTVRE